LRECRRGPAGRIRSRRYHASLESFQISVETFKGVVPLSGFVDTQAAIDRVRELARSVAGVKSVENNLILK